MRRRAFLASLAAGATVGVGAASVRGCGGRARAEGSEAAQEGETDPGDTETLADPKAVSELRVEPHAPIYVGEDPATVLNPPEGSLFLRDEGGAASIYMAVGGEWSGRKVIWRRIGG